MQWISFHWKLSLCLKDLSKRIECIHINLHIVARQEDSVCDLVCWGGTVTDVGRGHLYKCCECFMIFLVETDPSTGNKGGTPPQWLGQDWLNFLNKQNDAWNLSKFKVLKMLNQWLYFYNKELQWSFGWTHNSDKERERDIFENIRSLEKIVVKNFYVVLYGFS